MGKNEEYRQLGIYVHLKGVRTLASYTPGEVERTRELNVVPCAWAALESWLRGLYPLTLGSFLKGRVPPFVFFFPQC